MNKIIVEIRCPALANSFEFRISKNLSVSAGTEKIISEIRGFAHNDKIFTDRENISLFSARLNCVLNENMTFTENGVCGGDTLMII